MKKSYALFVAGLAMSLSATAVTKTADKTVSALEAQEMYSASQLSISNRVSNRPLKAAPKLSDFGPGQTIKLKPAPSMSRIAKQPLGPKTKTKQVI